MHITYDFWRGTEEPAEAAWRRVARIAMTPPLRDYIGARVLEMTSKWMFRVTTPMVVWQLTHDERMIAASLVCMLLPGLVMELIGGIVADRYNRRTIMVLSCVGSLATNLVIALMAMLDALTIHWLFALTALYGGITSVSHAASKTIVTAFVRKEDLSTAVSLNTVVFNVAGFIGPALAAGLIYSLGNAAAYSACALFTLAFVVLLQRVPDPETVKASQHLSFVRSLRDGLAHVLSVRLLLYVFIMHIGAIALARPFIEFVPAIVHHGFDGGVREAGWLLSSFGVGSVFGGLWLASCEASARRLATVALGAMPAFAAALLGIVLSPNLPMALVFSFAAGFGMITRGGAIQSMLQLEAAPAFRGRVMALHGVSFELGCIAGALMIGYVAKAATLTVALSLCVTLLVALWLAIRRQMMAAAIERDGGSAEPEPVRPVAAPRLAQAEAAPKVA